MDNKEIKETTEAVVNETASENKDAAQASSKKKKKAIMIVVALVVLAAAAVAAYWYFQKPATVAPEETTEGVIYAVVLDENGEPVTDENGEPVTTVAVTDANGNVVVTTPDGKTVPASTVAPKQETTTAGGGNAEPTKEVIKKPDAPKGVTGLKVTNATEDSITIKWDKVSCDGYQVSYSEDNVHWTNYPTDLTSLYTKTSMEFTKLKPWTRYYFSVRAYNINEAGVSASAWSGVIYGDTLEVEKEREITVSVKLPYDSGVTDTLEIWVKEDGARDYVKALEDFPELLMNGAEYSVTLPEKYKGVVTVWVGLHDHEVNDSAAVGGYEVSFDLSAIGADIVADDDEGF